jgi:replicative DNA helicase Mcm
MFSASIIGYNDVKEGLLYAAVNSGLKEIRQNSKKFRERTHVLLIGPPGLAKSMLLSASIKLVPNSRYESAQSSSAKSLTAIVVKEEDNQFLRIGPVPQAKFALCAINEIGRMGYDEQAHLLDVMEEASFTINKYGFNALITSPTTITASANPINNSKWNDDVKININEIPAIRPLIDRFDLIFTMRPVTEEKHLREYTYRKSQIINEKLEPDYTNYLWKHIMYSKQFHPIITEEAKSIINEFYIQLQKRSNNNFITPRTLDRLYRLVISRARLQLKDIADENDAIEILKFYNPIMQQLGDVVSIPSNPRNIAYLECVTILEQFKEFGGITLEELFKKASENNKQVNSYFGINKNLKIENNYKTKAVYHVLLNNPNIKKINDKPIILQWISSSNTKEEYHSSLSDVTDVSEVQSSSIEKNNKFEQSVKQCNDFVSDNINTDSNLDNDRNQHHIGSKNKKEELNDTTTLPEGKSQSLISIQKNFSNNKNQTSDTSVTSDRKLIDKEYNNSLITVSDLATGSYDPQIINYIDRFKGTDRWFCNNCTMRGDKWFMMKHPCRKNKYR